MSDHIANILERMGVPGESGLFVLGCLERPATVYMQQVRALNLIYALERRKLATAGSKLLVVGAGAGGLTAAAAAAALGWKVSVLDKHQMEVLQLAGADAPKRWLHPHIYDWPAAGTETPQTDLGIMDWHAGSAAEVVDKLRAEWRSLERAFEIGTHVGISNVTLGRLSTSQWLVQWNGDGPRSTAPVGLVQVQKPPRRLQQYAADVVILAVGFGREEKSAAFPEVHSYWKSDDIDGIKMTTNAPPMVLVSGTGDGGLIDALRYSYKRFQHETVLHQLKEKWLGDERYRQVKKELLDIEELIRDLAQAGKPYEPDLNFRYQSLSQALRSEGLRLEFRDDVIAVLAGRGQYPLTTAAAPINRFLFALTNVQYRQANLTGVECEGSRLKVKFDGKEDDYFTDVIIRHGPVPELPRDFPEIYQKVKAARDNWSAERLAQRDPTRDPHFDFTFKETLAANARTARSSTSVEVESIDPPILHQNHLVHSSTDPLEKYRRLLWGWRPLPPFFVETYAARELVDFATKPSSSGELAESVRLIIAPARAGKTTLLMQLASGLLADPIRVPVFVSARSLFGNSEKGSFVSAINIAVDQLVSDVATHDRLRTALLRATMQGRVVLLLDGLDELPHHLLLEGIQFMRMQRDDLRRGNRIIVASRPLSIGLDDIPSVRLKLFDNRRETWINELFKSGVPGIHAAIRHRLENGGVPVQLVETLENAALQSLYGDDVSAALESVVSSITPGFYPDRNFIESLVEPRFDGKGLAFSPTWARDLLAAVALARRWTTEEEVSQCVGLAYDARFAPTAVLAIAFTMSAAGNTVLHRLADLPDTLDLQVLDLRLKIAKYSGEIDQAIAWRLANDVARTVANVEVATVEQILNLADTCRELPDSLALLFSSEVEMVMKTNELEVVHRGLRFIERMPHAAEQLKSYLMHEDEMLARTAARAMGEIGDSDAIPALLAGYLAPMRKKILTEAVEAIAKIGGETAVSALLEVIENDERYVNFRWPAIEALGSFTPERALPPLLNAARDESATIRTAVARALGNYSHQQAYDALLKMTTDADEGVRAVVFAVLARRAVPKDIPLLREAMTDSSIWVRLAAAKGLERLDRIGLLELITAALEMSGDPWRAQAAALYGRLLGEAAIPQLGRLARSPDRNARLGAARGLAGIDNSEAIAILVQLCTDTDDEVRAAAIDVIPLRNDPEIIAAVSFNLMLDEGSSALAAIGRVEGFSHPQVVNTLRRIVLGPGMLGAMAARSLGLVGDERDIDLLELAWRGTPVTGEATPRCDHYAIAIGHIGGVSACKTLRRFLDDPLPDRRLSALQGLFCTGHAASIPPMLYALGDADEQVRLMANELLREADRGDLLPGLVAALRSASPSVQMRAAELAAPYADKDVVDAFDNIDAVAWGRDAEGMHAQLGRVIHEVYDLRIKARGAPMVA
ncbi:HEAT repeat domain-containing protein [Massilia sp. CMS3.1]|uniref:HEAT repeat domain-containing protein n=1 Tax=Massilia sp. CMS3.1 TaxID=3373083 RepID=UPI003EE44171